jgi:hypothetical protein
MAHGVQYILFMSVVSLNFEPHSSSKRFKIASTVKLLIITVLVGLLFYRPEDWKNVQFFAGNANLLRVADFIFGAILGATMSHFVIDAGAWRLSQTLQRAYIGKRFGFVFAGKPKGSSR